ncbi:hypothetical protein [Geomonas azotofigens]|uniref:hypothetical protein n=1 Tax=Geomonas azotofigens TaxID=2843196 RepID=UPI001C101D94|nr:hypothetical protein [Geomonas azotofigens]MBU5614527.1 hypothetical protein [Geomonas azotofigens]
MKKQFVAAAAVAGLALGAVVAQGADSKGAGIKNSVHDLSGYGTGATATSYVKTVDPGKRLCAYCHTPHHSAFNNQDLAAEISYLGLDATSGLGTTAASYKIYAPLWSRTDVRNGGYGTYVSQTFDPERQNKVYDPLIGPSRLCLSCHDGSIAIDSYYGQTVTNPVTTGDAFNTALGGGGVNSIGIAGGYSAMAGTGGLTNDHPIGMRYSDYQGKQDPNGTDYELNVTTKTFTATDGSAGKTISSVLYTDPSDTNVNGFVTCASCHDVHNGNAVGNKAPEGNMRGFLLYGSQVQSSFCLTCHNK